MKDFVGRVLKKGNGLSFRVVVPVLHTWTATPAFSKKKMPYRHSQSEETLQHFP